jgi:hypothetical protein
MRNFVTTGLFAASVALLSTPAFAVSEAEYDSLAFFSFSIDDVKTATGASSTDYEVDVIIEDAFTDIDIDLGSTSNTDSAFADGAVIEGAASASGAADVPGGVIGTFASSFISADILNLSGEDLTFEVSFALFASTEADIDLVPGFFTDALAFAEAEIALTSSTSADIGDILLETVTAESDALFGFGLPTDEDDFAVSLSFVIAADDFATLDLAADVEGAAAVIPSVIPLPATLPLMLGGIGLLAWARRRA